MTLIYGHSVLWLLLGFNVLCLVHAYFKNVGVSYTITLNVYSGREDPEWTIDSNHPMYSKLTWALNNGPSPTTINDYLGYAGFTVNARNLYGQNVYKTIGRNSNRLVETLLLESCKDSVYLSPNVINHVLAGIYGQLSSSDKVSVKTSKSEDDGVLTIKHKITYGRQKRQAQICSTKFEPDNWNYMPVQRNNNCYNYATNRQTNTFAQPGRASGQRYTATTASNVYAATVRDGLTPLSTPDGGNECLVALVIWEEEDYHFLRLDNNGYWSQKSGRTRTRATDDSSNVITDPRTADRGPYTIFAGWLGVGPNASVQ